MKVLLYHIVVRCLISLLYGMKDIRKTSFCTVLASSFLLWLGTSLCSFLNCEYQCHQTPFGGECFCPPSHIININDSRTCTGKWQRGAPSVPSERTSGTTNSETWVVSVLRLFWGDKFRVTSDMYRLTTWFLFLSSCEDYGGCFQTKFVLHDSPPSLSTQLPDRLLYSSAPFFTIPHTPSPTHGLRFMTFQISSCTCIWTWARAKSHAGFQTLQTNTGKPFKGPVVHQCGNK